jgi:2,3-bisphosphoglycerate-dependent phosphoglycerate mutase
MSPFSRLWLIRHGQTDWNRAGRIQGQSPTHLNAEGRAEADALAEVLATAGHQFAACYSSDLPRAAETAAILAQRLPVAVHLSTALRERHFGPLEGAFPDQIRAARAAAGLPHSADLADWTGMPGVESNDALWDRISAALRDLADRHPGRNILVITHGGVIARTLFRTLGIPDGSPRRFPLSNGMLAILESRPDFFRLVTLADILLLAGRAPARDTATISSALPKPN